MADFGGGLLSCVENETLRFKRRGSVRLRWSIPGFFWGVRIDFRGVDFLLGTLETSEEVVDIKETASESSSFISSDATSCATMRRPKNCPVDFLLSEKLFQKNITFKTILLNIHALCINLIVTFNFKYNLINEVSVLINSCIFKWQVFINLL